jgi:hypothetical protein
MLSEPRPWISLSGTIENKLPTIFEAQWPHLPMRGSIIMIRTLLLAAALAFAAPVVVANSTPACADVLAMTEGKSSVETVTILNACREQSKGLPAIALPEPAEAEQWSVAAKGIAEAVGIAAKELGIATNDFLDSPAGYVVAGLLFLHFGADSAQVVANFVSDAIQFAIGVPLLGLFVWYLVAARPWVKTKREYTLVPVLWGAFSIRRVTSKESSYVYIDGEGAHFMYALGAIFQVAILLILFL